MDGILIILFLIWLFRRIARNYKRVTQNAPGASGAQKKPLISLYTGSDSASRAKKEQPSAPKAAEEALHRASEALFDACGVLDESDQAPAQLQEGESRACSHGTVGGSMESADHQGMGEAFVHARQQVETRVEATLEPAAKPIMEATVKTQVHVSRSEEPTQAADEDTGASAQPVFTAAQMRQAVVMAEILRRPAERRRWSAR